MSRENSTATSDSATQEVAPPKVTWQRFSDYYFDYPSVQLALDISHMRFTDSYLSEMRTPAEAALSSMQALEDGAIANPDENRMVGHYWLRAPELAPSTEITSTIADTIAHVKRFAAQIHAGEISAPSGNKFRDVVLIGIGGSALGPQLLEEVFATPKRQMRLHFIDNTDPDGMERCFTTLVDRLAETLVLVVSKSGGTVETKNGQLVAEAVFSQQGLDFAQHAVAITCQGSKLDTLAKQQSWCAQFYLWDWVGGRTSIFSAVGLLPAALLGVDIDAFLSGAAEMDRITREESFERNPAMLLALMWHWAGDGRGEKTMVVLPYKDRLSLFSKYLQQLVMESLGKEKDLQGRVVHQGLSVFGNKGSSDQHAYVQQLRDGRSDFFVTFIEVLQRSYHSTFGVEAVAVDESQSCADFLQGFYLGTRTALFEGARDSISITLRTLDEFSIAALIALYERAVGLYASLINVNAYHQPGVEAGKKAAVEVIELQRKILHALPQQTQPLSATALAEQIEEKEHTALVFKLLLAMAHEPRFGMSIEGALQPQSAKFSMQK